MVLAFNMDVLNKLTHFVEDLDAIGLSVTYINETIIAKSQVVYDLQKPSADARINLGLCSLLTPLTEEMPFTIKHHDTLITRAIGDIYVPIGWINGETPWAIEQRVTGVHRSAAERAVGGVEHSPRADLQ